MRPCLQVTLAKPSTKNEKKKKDLQNISATKS